MLEQDKKEWILSSIFLASPVDSSHNFCLQGGQENMEGDMSMMKFQSSPLIQETAQAKVHLAHV